MSRLNKIGGILKELKEQKNKAFQKYLDNLASREKLP